MSVENEKTYYIYCGTACIRDDNFPARVITSFPEIDTASLEKEFSSVKPNKDATYLVLKSGDNLLLQVGVGYPLARIDYSMLNAGIQVLNSLNLEGNKIFLCPQSKRQIRDYVKHLVPDLKDEEI